MAEEVASWLPELSRECDPDGTQVLQREVHRHTVQLPVRTEPVLLRHATAAASGTGSPTLTHAEKLDSTGKQSRQV
jgi:hypothetical protein